MSWYGIACAPRDGSFVRTAQDVTFAGTRAGGVIDTPIYALLSRFIDGQWCADFGGEWRPYDPQPKFWEPRFDQMKLLRRPLPQHKE